MDNGNKNWRAISRGGKTSALAATMPQEKDAAALFLEIAEYLETEKRVLVDQWVKRIEGACLLTSITTAEVFAEAHSLLDCYVDALKTGALDQVQSYTRDLSERITARGVKTYEIVGSVFFLRDVLSSNLFGRYQKDVSKLHQILNAYNPSASRIALTVVAGFAQEQEHIMREQQEAIRELSTPVLQVRNRLLILPIIGLLDDQRAQQLTEQLLQAIRRNRAKVVVIDITGVLKMDSSAANHLVQTVEASRLLGAFVIVTGISPIIAQTLVNIGADLRKMKTVGDLQGGIEEAERLLEYKVVTIKEVE